MSAWQTPEVEQLFKAVLSRESMEGADFSLKMSVP